MVFEMQNCTPPDACRHMGITAVAANASLRSDLFDIMRLLSSVELPNFKTLRVAAYRTKHLAGKLTDLNITDFMLKVSFCLVSALD